MANQKTKSTSVPPSGLPLALPDCDASDALEIGRAEAMNLYRWVHLVECSACEFEIDPRELAGMVGHRLQALIQFFDVAIEHGKAAS